MNFKKLTRFKKAIIISLAAGVVVSQSLPVVCAAELSAEEETSVVPGGGSGQSSGDNGGDSSQSGSGSAAGEDSGSTGNTDTTGGTTDSSETGGSQTPSDASGTGSASKDTEPTSEDKSAADSAAQSDVNKNAEANGTTQTDAKDNADPNATKAAQAEQPAETTAVEATVPLTDDDSVKETEDLHEDDTEVIPEGDLVPAPVINNSFRFWTVAKDYAYASEDVMVMEEKSDSAREIGELKKDALCYLIKDEGDWYYIESGTVRGFVETDKLLTGEDAVPLTKELEETAGYVSARTGMDIDIEDVASKAYEYITKKENKAFAYERATVYQTVVERDPVLPAKGKINIREKANEKSRIVGILPADGIAYVIADKDDDWVYVESGDVRGFVKSELLEMTDNLTKDEADYATATQKIAPEDNKALYYTMTSIRSGVPDGMLRNSILQYASQFIGNPYVWGGTSLTNGADCSGFVLSIFAQYGYSLPHSSAEQATCGTPIEVEDALPGDLIFYGDDNGIYHVVIYAGDGKTIEAKSTKYGIVASKVSYGSAVAAVRIIDEKDAVRYDIPSGLGSIHTYMGWQKVTDRRSQQWAFKKAAGMTFDPEGFGVVDNRYVVACTSTYGNIGDYVDFYQEDGTVIPCIIGDFKNQNDPGCNAYGHMDGDCIIEFVVDQKSWYQSGHANPGTDACHPEWNQNIIKAENVGSYYE